MSDKLSRRGFVGAAAGTAAAATLGPFAAGASAKHRHRHHHKHHHDHDALLPKSRIGIQLYTIRDQVDALGFDEAFRRLAEIGYKEVEFAGYNAQGRRWSNQELRGLLRKYGLKATGSHVGYTGTYSFRSSLEQVLDDAEEIGMKYIGTASSPAEGTSQTPDGYKAAAEEFNRFGAAARRRGLRFYQHNHDSEWEVVNGTRLYDVLFENTDPRLVFLEMDIFWAFVGQSRFPGFRPSDYVWNHPERYPLFHVKDGLYTKTGPHSGWVMTDVGAGDLPYEPFFCGLDTSRHHFIMENDDARQAEGGSWGDAERSYDYMASLRERRR
jgi:sugar phosphate isomerase/epimerase